MENWHVVDDTKMTMWMNDDMDECVHGESEVQSKSES